MTDKDKDVEVIEEDFAEACEINVSRPNILMVLTEADRFDEHHKTGVWFEEFAIPYLKFIDEGYDVSVATLHGKEAPLDPASTNIIDDIKWHKAKEAMKSPQKLSEINCSAFDAVVIPGGHGPLFDLADSEEMGDVLIRFYEEGKLIAAICHGPAALLSAKKADIPLVKGYELTAFTNEEEIEAKKDGLVPFSVEDKLKEAGAKFVKEAPGAVYVVNDRNIITAQNYQSAGAFAVAIIEYLSEKV